MRKERRTQDCLKHYRIPEPNRHDAKPLLYEPRVLAQKHEREHATQRQNTKNEINGFISACAVHEPALGEYNEKTQGKEEIRTVVTRRTTNRDPWRDYPEVNADLRCSLRFSGRLSGGNDETYPQWTRCPKARSGTTTEQNT